MDYTYDDPKVINQGFKNSERYNSQGKEAIKSFDPDKDNLIIKGDNMAALGLLKLAYKEKVKLIYIDPPYNNGKSSFAYEDDLDNDEWFRLLTKKIHTVRQLLRDDGAIFISIDEAHEAYVKAAMDILFGEENLLSVFHIQVRYTQKSLNESGDFQPVMEYVLAYAKNKKLFKPNKPYKEYDLSKFKWEINELVPGRETTIGGKRVKIFQKGEYEVKKLAEPSLQGLQELYASGSLLVINSSGRFYDSHLSNRKNIDGLATLYKVYGIGNDGLGYRYFISPKRKNALRGKFYSGIPVDRLQKLKKGQTRKYYPIVNYYDYSSDFSNIRLEGGVPFNRGKKPESLLKWIIELATNENDLVLDFFLGSGTTTATAMKLKRRFVGVEREDYIKDITVKRMLNVINGDPTGVSKSANWQGGSSFVYTELSPEQSDS